MAFTDEKLTADDLLAAAQQLDEVEFERLYAGLGRLRQPKVGRVLSARETELLTKINAGLPDRIWKRYSGLRALQRERDLTASERDELVRVTDALEAYQAERAGWLLELSQMRGVHIHQLIEDLQIRPVVDAE